MPMISFLLWLVRISSWITALSVTTAVCAIPAIFIYWAKVEEALKRHAEAKLRKRFHIPADTAVSIEVFRLSSTLVELRGVEIGNPASGIWASPYLLRVECITVGARIVLATTGNRSPQA